MSKVQLEPVEIAEKQRRLYLLEKIKNNQHLSRLEIEELAKYEKKTALEAGKSSALEAHKSSASKAGKKSQNGGRPSKSSIAAEQIIKTQREAADFAGVNVRTIRRWNKNDMPRTPEGWYIKQMLLFYKANEGSRHTEHKEKHAKAEAELKQTKAKLAELELRERQGEFVSREMVEKENTRKVLALKRSLLGMGRKLAPQLARMKDVGRCQKVIDTEIRMLIKDFAK